MKYKKSELLTVGLFCGFLFGMLLCYLVLPKSDFSVREKRYLAEAPKASWESVSSGAWGNEAETYMADHIPGRNFFVGLNAYFELLTGRQAGKDVRLKNGYLLEAPVTYDEAGAEKKMKTVINGFAEKIGTNVDLMIVPSAGWAMGEPGYRDREIISDIYDLAGDLVTPVDATGVFAGKPQLYYRTDHHWTSEGAYEGYRCYMICLGRDCRSKEDFHVEVQEDFRGSTYSRSALWLTEGERLELWHGSENLTVTNGESETDHSGVFYPERLEEADKYTVFLDGNHSIVRVRNPEKQGKLLVIRDSYSNALGCFLAESYGEVVLVDLRYYKQPVSQLVTEENFDNVLICYSIGNFMTDVNFSWLR